MKTTRREFLIGVAAVAVAPAVVITAARELPRYFIGVDLGRGPDAASFSVFERIEGFEPGRLVAMHPEIHPSCRCVLSWRSP